MKNRLFVTDFHGSAGQHIRTPPLGVDADWELLNAASTNHRMTPDSLALPQPQGRGATVAIGAIPPVAVFKFTFPGVSVVQAYKPLIADLRKTVAQLPPAPVVNASDMVEGV